MKKIKFFVFKSKRRTSVFLFALIVLNIFVLSGCAQQTTPEKPEMEEPSFTVKDYPAVDGSTVTIPLSEALGARLMNLPVEEARQYIVHNKTHQAYVNLINKDADLIFVTGPSAEELQLAKDNDVELELIPVVGEGFVFLVSNENTVTNLKLDEIRDIYSGKITNWKDVGGSDVPITAYQRPVNSGSQTGFLQLVMGKSKPVDPPMEQVVAEMGALIDAVASYKNEPNAIGYSYYYFVTDMWGNEKIRLLSVDGVYPDKQTIRDGSYPVRTEYYAVMRKDEPADSPARKVAAWILTEEGQQLAEEAGYVKVR